MSKPPSWNEIRTNAQQFANRWEGTSDENAESQSFWNEFLGIFGIHNLVAGYFSRGIVMLVLSVFTFMGACMVVAPPCLCLGVPLWIVLFVLSVVEAITVTSDARGRAFV